jgi:hypothetical protein
MVPGSGTGSNHKSPLLTEWNRNSKDYSEALDSLPEGLELDQLFTTLAEWNDYLENHVPYFSEQSVTEEREP